MSLCNLVFFVQEMCPALVSWIWAISIYWKKKLCPAKDIGKVFSLFHLLWGSLCSMFISCASPPLLLLWGWHLVGVLQFSLGSEQLLHWPALRSYSCAPEGTKVADTVSSLICRLFQLVIQGQNFRGITIVAVVWHFYVMETSSYSPCSNTELLCVLICNVSNLAGVLYEVTVLLKNSRTEWIRNLSFAYPWWMDFFCRVIRIE